MYSYIAKSVFDEHLGSSNEPCYIRNRVTTNRVIKRLMCTNIFKLNCFFDWCWFAAFKTKNFKSYFLRESSDFLCLHFHNGKSPSEENFICRPIFKIFVVLFMTFGIQKDDKI